MTALNLDDTPVSLPAADAHTVASEAADLVDGTLTFPPRGSAVLEASR